jgi:adenosylmethionine-8-amino-7-oxononanoate aminotransferase
MFQTRSPRWNFPAIQVPNIQTLEALAPGDVAKIAAVVIEPLIQGAAGMRIWPSGMLRAVREWCSRTDTLLIVDEVMTGFGRTGRMFASEHEDVVPDMMVLGKGLTGGYLSLAITLISEKLFFTFNGSIAEGKALAYGHSYTGNALGCAAAKASLEVFEKERVLDVRQCGFIAGIEMEDSLEAAGPAMAAAVCIEARCHGLLTRPISNVVVLMPPLCITIAQLTKAVEALRASISKVWRCSNASARKDAEEVTA